MTTEENGGCGLLRCLTTILVFVVLIIVLDNLSNIHSILEKAAG